MAFPNSKFERPLSDREQSILMALIDCHLATGEPVGSQALAQRYGLQLSPATIRNVAADLETKGYLRQPHKSAGRVPTDAGYRAYIDQLMLRETLCEPALESAWAEFEEERRDVDAVLDRTARVLATISHQLTLAVAPTFDDARLERIRLVPVRRDRALAIMELDGAPVRTVLFELDSSPPVEAVERVTSHVNQRLAGLTLSEIRRTIGDRLDPPPIRGAQALTRRLIDDRENLFVVGRAVHIGGAADLLAQVDAGRSVDLAPLFRLLEDEERAPRVFESDPAIIGHPVVRIGSENPQEELQALSVVSCAFRVGAGQGTIGLIGPTRMRYSRLIPMVESTANRIGALVGSLS